jgi:hypothetical protein
VKIGFKDYNIPFINSTLVISAWENDRLIGAVRVLSDKMFRSIIYLCFTDISKQWTHSINRYGGDVSAISHINI